MILTSGLATPNLPRSSSIMANGSSLSAPSSGPCNLRLSSYSMENTSQYTSPPMQVHTQEYSTWTSPYTSGLVWSTVSHLMNLKFSDSLRFSISTADLPLTPMSVGVSDQGQAKNHLVHPGGAWNHVNFTIGENVHAKHLGASTGTYPPGVGNMGILREISQQERDLEQGERGQCECETFFGREGKKIWAQQPNSCTATLTPQVVL